MRRFRSSHVVLGGMGALALTLTSCGSSEPDRRCVDRVTRDVLPDYNCSDNRGSGSSGGSGDKAAVQRGGFGCSGSGGG